MSNKLLIIVEGPDRCGKGTITDYFRSMLITPKLTYMHLTKPPSNLRNFIQDDDNASDVYATWNYDRSKHLMQQVDMLFRTCNTDIIILDRSYISEYVYGHLFRGAEYTKEEFAKAENSLLSYLSDSYNYNLNLIVTVDNPQSIQEREDGESQSSTIADRQNEVNRYKQLLEWSKIKNKHLVDWSEVPFNNATLNRILTNVLITGYNSTD